ncbi:MAG: restriction endonuclease subunit S [Rikenellaceae bacterium]
MGKIVAPLDKKLQGVEWGEFKYTELFELLVGRKKLDKSNLANNGTIPVYSSDTSNNGIVGYTNLVADYNITTDFPIYLIFGDHTRTMNIAQSDFCVMDNVKVLIPKIDNVKILLFVCAVWKRNIPNLGYARHWTIAKDISFLLPVKNGIIDFDFMDSFIAELEVERLAELEVERLAELEAYLSATGLEDYTLTEEEQNAIDNFDNLKFDEFKIVDIFSVKNSGNILSRDIVADSGYVPYLCASADNNAVSSYISYDEKYLDKGNCIFIGGKTFVVTYQENDFYSNDSHNLILHINESSAKDKLGQLYLATCINRSLGYKYTWGDSISKTKIQKDMVSLPIKGKNPNYTIMNTFISAIQKLVIKDVVLYANEKIAATKTVVNK